MRVFPYAGNNTCNTVTYANMQVIVQFSKNRALCVLYFIKQKSNIKRGHTLQFYNQCSTFTGIFALASVFSISVEKYDMLRHVIYSTCLTLLKRSVAQLSLIHI